MKRRPWLARRLVLGAIVWIALSIGAGGVFLSYAFQNAVLQSFDAQITAQLRAIVAGLETAEDGALRLEPAPDDARYAQIFSGWYWQVNQGDAPVLRSRSLWDTELPRSAADATVRLLDVQGPQRQPLRAAIVATQLPDAGPPVTVTVAVTLAAIDPEIERFNVLLFGALGLLAAGLIVAILLQVWIGLSPLRRLAEELARIRDGEAEKLSDLHPREIEPLVQAFNDVRTHDLQTLTRARKEAGNLAHALKLPLARLAAELGETSDAVKENAQRSVDELKSLIDLHTARASTAAVRGIGAKRIALKLLVEEIIGALRKIYAEKSIGVEANIAADVRVRAEEEDMAELLGNLLDNGFKWAKTRVTITAAASADAVTIAIEDDGPGIAEDQLNGGVERGRRLDESVPGSGLGLSIALDLAEAYGGDLSLHRSPALGGLQVRVTLPLTAAATKPRA